MKFLNSFLKQFLLISTYYRYIYSSLQSYRYQVIKKSQNNWNQVFLFFWLVDGNYE